MNAGEIVVKLKSLENPENILGMARFGIVTKKAFGISAPILKELAKQVKKSAENRHLLALELWKTEIHEARIIAYLIDDPKEVSEKQLEDWASDFDNWAICDSTCGTLFCKTVYAYRKAFEWSEREEEFVKRAGIVLMAGLAVHDKKADDEKIACFLPVLETLAAANDERPLIKKAISWSLRQIGKRSLALNRPALETAQRIRLQNTKTARWIASDVLRELKSEKVLQRLEKRYSTSSASRK